MFSWPQTFKISKWAYRNCKIMSMRHCRRPKILILLEKLNPQKNIKSYSKKHTSQESQSYGKYFYAKISKYFIADKKISAQYFLLVCQIQIWFVSYCSHCPKRCQYNHIRQVWWTYKTKDGKLATVTALNLRTVICSSSLRCAMAEFTKLKLLQRFNF
jgi:hypothetical protein